MQREICERIAITLARAPIHDPLGYEALAYLKLPGPDYLSTLRALHGALKPKLYVEIGVRQGASLRLAHEDTRVIAIDPAPAIGPRPNTVLAVSTSDAFFENEANRDKVRGFDLAFIDGDHSFEQALRDFENLERLAKPSSVIAIHDVIPMDERTSTPKAETAFHTGDVWRLMAHILYHRSDLIAFTIACAPTGLGIVGRFTRHWFIWPKVHNVPFPKTWAEQYGALNIIPNEAAAIMAAFRGAA